MCNSNNFVLLALSLLNPRELFFWCCGTSKSNFCYTLSFLNGSGGSFLIVILVEPHGHFEICSFKKFYPIFETKLS
jgi:hypothetical protein